MQSGSVTPSCDCFVARHPQAVAIEAALRGGEDPRRIAERFGVSKTKLYEHRGHLGLGAAPRARKAALPPAELSAEREASFRGTAEQSADSSARARPQLPETTGGTGGGQVRGTGNYHGAIRECARLISGGEWRQRHVQELADKFGLTIARTRQAKTAATHYLAANLGDYSERQMLSASYTMQHRDDSASRAERCMAQAAAWAERERIATEVAEACEDEEQKVVLFDAAARAGMVATRYGLEAEKWKSLALKAQMHADDILCLKSPTQVVNATQVNIGTDKDLFAQFAAALAARFRHQPDVRAEIERASAEIEASTEVGDVDAIETVGEAA